MKKYLLSLIALMISALGIQAHDILPAYSEVAEDGETVQYLFNVETKSFVLGANDWNTRASVSQEKGYQFKVKKNADGKYTLNDYVETQNAWKAMFADNGSSIWVDNLGGANVNGWVIESNGDGTYTITNPGAQSDAKLGVQLTLQDTRLYLDTNPNNGMTWAFVSPEAYEQYFTEAAEAIAAEKQEKLYQSNLAALAAQKALIDGTNVYEAEGYAAYVAAYEANVALVTPEYTGSIVNPAAPTEWHASTAYNFLLKPWTINDVACNGFDANLYINTWSTEGNTDGSNFTVPFFEYWTGDENKLAAAPLKTVVSNLLPGQIYDVTAWVRVRLNNGSKNDAAKGITLTVGDGEALDVCTGEQVGETQFRLLQAKATGKADAEGNLTITFTVDADNNISWLSYKNVYYAEGKEDVFITASDGKKYKVLSENLVANGSFDEGLDGWLVASYAQDAATAGTDMTVVAEGGYDGGAYAQTKPAGKGATSSLMGKWNVEAGKLYYIAAYTGGTAPAANNLQYNKIWTLDESDNETALVQLNWPATVDEWALTDAAFTATTPAVAIRLAWNDNARLDGVQLYEVEEAGVDLDIYKATAIAGLPVADESLFTPSAESIEAIIAAIQAATTVEEVDAAAATEPTIPALSGEWTIKNAAEDLYLGEAKLSTEGLSTTFEKVAGGFSIKVGDKYINMAGNNNWSMSATEEATTAWNFNLADGAYTIQGPKGLIGVDNLEADAPTYGNKAVDNNGLWVIEAYVAPDPYASTLAVAAVEGKTYLTDKINIGENTYDAYKIGTSSATGTIGVTIPAGSYGMSFYALSWNTATTDVTATAGEKTQTYSATGAGISGNSPYTYDAEKGGEPETHLYKFGYSEPLAEDVVVNLTAPARIVFFGINALTEPVQEEAAGWDGTVTTSLDDVTMTSVAEFEGITLKFNGAKSIVVNSIEEDGETLYGSFEAWNPDFSEYYMWTPYYGSTYEVNGDEITLTGWIDVNAMMGDTELQTKIAKKLARRVAEGDTDYQFEMMDYGETFIIDGEVYEEQIDLFFNAKEASAVEPFAFTVINNNVEAESAETKEATEVSVMFQISSDYDVEKGEGVPTLSANGEDQGAATVTIVDGVGVIKFEAAPAATDGVFTAAGTYTLTIPEGTFVDVNGAPNALFGASWVIIEKEEPVLADGDYLIKNAEFGKYLNGSNDWGTKASVTEHGQFMTIALNDGKYSIKSHYSNGSGKDYLAAGDNTYLDAAVVYHEITAVEGGFTIKDANGKYLVSDGNVANFNGDEPQVWQFLSKEDVIASLADATAEAPVDATALVPDADFSRNNTDFNKWEGESKMGKGGPNNAKDATARGMNAERWGGNSTSIDFHTTLTDLPNGKYTVKFQGLYRYNNTTDNTNDVAAAAHADGSEYIAANFYANEIAAPFTSVADEASVELYGKMPFSQAEASEAFTMGCYQNELTVVVTDGTLTLKVVKLEADHEGCDWTVLDNIELYYLGDNSGEPENIVIENVEIATVTEGEQNDVHYTATVKFQKPAGAKYAYSEGLMLEGSNVPFALGAYGFASLEEGNEVTLVYKDALKAKTDDPTYDGEKRAAGTYQATTTILFMDENQWEIPATATFTGTIVLPDLNETGINEVKFHINSVVYTINGVRVQKPVKGINIINGKKVVIK